MIYISSLDKVVYATTSKVGKGLQISNQYLQSTNAATPSNTIKISYNNVTKNQGYLTWKNSAGNSCRNVMQGSYGKTTMTSTSAKNTTSSTPYSYTTSTGTVTTSSSNNTSRKFATTHSECLTRTKSTTQTTGKTVFITVTDSTVKGTFLDGGHIWGIEGYGTQTRITAELDMYNKAEDRGKTLGGTTQAYLNYYYTNYWSSNLYKISFASAKGDIWPIPRRGDFRIASLVFSSTSRWVGVAYDNETNKSQDTASFASSLSHIITANCESFKPGTSNIEYKESTAGTITSMAWSCDCNNITFSLSGTSNAYTEWWSGTTSTKTTIDSSQKTDTTVKDNWIREYSATATNISSTLYPSKSSSYTSTY